MNFTSRIIEHAQGTEAWHQHRSSHLNASELASAMGLPGAYVKRGDLIRQRATGITPEVDEATARRFAQGHEFEAIAREWAEDMLQDTLYPTVLAADVEGLPLSVSLDGQTLTGEVIFEHKTGRADLLASLEAGVIPEHYHPQLEQGLMLSGAERCLFMASSGDREAMRFAWYESRPELREQIVPVWRQFLADVAAYVPPVAAEPAKPAPMESLPAVSVRLDGALTVIGNLPAFGAALRDFVEKIPKQPKNDDEFATCDAACKALKKAEEALDAAEAGALASITDVEAMRRAVADCRNLARDTRLAAEKMVERRKVQIKEEAVAAARRELDAHIAGLNAELAPMALRPAPVDFAGAIKGLRSFASMDDALRTAVANGKIAADAQAKGIRANVATFKAAAGDDTTLQALFADLGQIVHKAADDFAALVDNRIATHRANEAAKEAKRQADEAARIADEQVKRQQPADSGPAVELLQDHSRGLSIALASKPEAPVLARQAAATIIAQRAKCDGNHGGPRCADPECWNDSPAKDEPANLSLGTICQRLGFTVNAAFLAELHVQPARTDKAAKLYTESQFQVICRQLVAHVGAVAELHAGETV